ncbi:MAG: hypothetical protein OEW11_11125 [Nitrospirota bacterium]|nr:hypothetical protein [Nitrospirota bacterium]
MEQEPMFFEGEEEALAACLSGLNQKVVAAQVWPNMSLAQATARLRAVSNPERRETASMAEVILIMRVTGRYYPLYYMAQESSHSRPHPISSEDAQTALMQQVLRQVEALKPLLARVAKTERFTS